MKLALLLALATKCVLGRDAAPTLDAGPWVLEHNRVRKPHCARPVSWSPTLAATAQQWADSLKAKGCVQHYSGAPGENVAVGPAGSLSAEHVVTRWYVEGSSYSFADGGFAMATGHFSQVIWASTMTIGCGHVTCGAEDVVVCHYDPPGNRAGQYAEQVLPASCR